MKDWKTWAIAGLIVLAGAGVILALRMRNTSQETSFTQVVAVERGDLAATITPTGEVSAERRTQLSFNVSRIALAELYVIAGQQVKKGDVLARIDPAPLEQAVAQTEADLLSAQEALEEAQKPPTEMARLKADLEIVQAEVALEEAKQALEEALKPDSSAIENATRTLQQAEANLAALQSDSTTQSQIDRLQWLANEAEVKHGALLTSDLTTELGRDRLLLAYNNMLDTRDNLEAAKARAALDLLNAQDKVVQARDALAKLKTGPDTAAVTQARYKVALAEYNLAQANDKLTTLLAGPDPKTLQLAQSRYDAAKATLDEAQTALEAATMVAPFDATVISVGAQVGDLVSSSTTVVTLADLSNMQILANVDETDISQVQVGQDVLITFDAFPGTQFWGNVLEVPLEGKLVQNIVRYEVRVSLQDASTAALRSGMTANLTIIVGYSPNALLLPVLAVRQAEQGYVVMLQASTRGATVAMPVEVGLSDGQYIEVLRGLNEGDRVLVEYQPVQQQQAVRFSGAGFTVPGGQLGR
jgi:HlyD family secretion protein